MTHNVHTYYAYRELPTFVELGTPTFVELGTPTYHVLLNQSQFAISHLYVKGTRTAIDVT